jgi:predicted dehydrogenase
MAQDSAKYGRICQVGTQSRSNPGMREAIEFIHGGGVGEVKLAYGTCYKPRKSIGQVESPTEPPTSMDYDLWTGPAALLPVKRKKLHYDWHWVWEYGNGDFGNQGVHEADKARWGLSAGLPVNIISVGGRVGYVDDGETPNTQLNFYEFEGGKHLLFEVRGLDTKDYMGSKVGNIWFGSKGTVVCPSYSSGMVLDPNGKTIKEFKGGGDHFHFENFVKAVRSRNRKDLHCDVEEGHISAALCHLGNISYRLGKPAVFADDIKAFEKLVAANEAFERMKAHIADNKVEVSSAKCFVGAKLTFDPKTEKITAADDLAKANAMLFREYRKGFDITEAV